MAKGSICCGLLLILLAPLYLLGSLAPPAVCWQRVLVRSIRRSHFAFCCGHLALLARRWLALAALLALLLLLLRSAAAARAAGAAGSAARAAGVARLGSLVLHAAVG